MDTSRSRAPRRLTSEMPGSRSNSPRMCSAVRCSDSPLACADETATVRAVTSNRTGSISGSLAFGGGKLSMPSTAFSTSCSTPSPSDSGEYSMRMVPRSAAAVPRTRSTPEMPITASSTRRTMSSSTSRADDPGDSTATSTTYGTFSGTSRTTSVAAASSPMTATPAISRLAATGLPAK